MNINEEYKKTLDYYNQKAADFTKNTVDVEFSKLQQDFASQIKKNGTILDLGCGSGRDTKAFAKMGFRSIAVDGSPEMCKVAEETTGQPVICSSFQDFRAEVKFDGIWACASLLHLNKKDIHDVVSRLSGYMNTDACLYLSFKYGDFAGERNGRYFTDLKEDTMINLLKDISCLELVKTEVTSDVRPGRADEKWLNAFYRKK